jgi:radical SAM protein with 4Fe4S-binding SPASM domain
VNINDGTPEEISEIYAKSEIILSLISRKYKGKCGTCSLKRMCGGCRAVAEGVNGDYLSSDITCWR